VVLPPARPVGELTPGGINTEVVVNQARSLLAEIEPDDVAAVQRHRQAGGLPTDAYAFRSHA
jgi:hypothetical protein